jgi:pimeloyl-ACP methyl ester carboxylesterase
MASCTSCARACAGAGHDTTLTEIPCTARNKLPYCLRTGAHHEVLLPGFHVFMSPKHLDVLMQLPLPGIVIFVHGVNSDGEWYRQAEAGLCDGLNDRLKRCNEHMAYPTPQGGQLTPVKYLSELTADGFINPRLRANNFVGPSDHFSPVIQFRWGYKASAEELQLYGNATYLNEENYWGGGPFANGCTALPDLWGAGLSDELFLWLHVQHMNPTSDRKVYACPPRPYYVIAALRLARLVEAIRARQADVPITIVCHSQGNMIGMAAAFLGDRLPRVTDAAGKTGRCVADNYVLCNAPFSLVKSNTSQGLVERSMKDSDGNGGRQTGDARSSTLKAFFEIVRQQAQTEQPAASLDEWMKNEAHGFAVQADRDSYGYGSPKSTYGRVTLYFNPHDQVISSSTIQGIGWRGLSQPEIDAAGGAGMFCQRVFAQDFLVGAAGKYDFWADQYNRPKRGSLDFYHPHSLKAGYELSKGLRVNTTWFGKVMSVASAPILYVVTGIAGIRINALPPNDWITPLAAPNLPHPFMPEAVRFGAGSTAFDQGMDAPGDHRDKERQRVAGDPYAGDRKVPNHATKEARLKGNDAAEGDTGSEAALRYEHHAMLRMEARREGIFANNQKVTDEDSPANARVAYTAWRNEKIREALADNIDTHATDHSTIMTNAMHAQKALAYDVAVGVCRIRPKDLMALRVMADWRFLDGVDSKESCAEFIQYFIEGTFRGLSAMEWATTSDEGSMPSKIINKREIFSK